MKRTVQSRLSNFELMRIVAMIFIIVSHYAQHGLLPKIFVKSTVIQFFTMYLHTLGAIGVTLFLLLTGYFMIDKEVKAEHFFRVAIETIFYSWSIYLLFAYIFEKWFIYTFESIFPILTGQYWFVTAYLILYLMIPVLNKLFYSLDKQTLKRYLFLFVFIWFVIPLFNGKVNLMSSFVLIFVCIYFIGAYIKKYGIPFFENKRNILITILFSEGIICLYQFMHVVNGILAENQFMYITWSNSILTLLTSVSLFYIFKNYKLDYNPIINYFSSSAFAVYLITENIFMRRIIWGHIFQCNLFNNGLFIFFNIIIAVITSYIICTIIDKIRIKFFGQWLLEYIESIYKKFFCFINKLI